MVGNGEVAVHVQEDSTETETLLTPSQKRHLHPKFPTSRNGRKRRSSRQYTRRSNRNLLTQKLKKAKGDLKWMTNFSTAKSATTLALNVSQLIALILMIVKGLIIMDHWNPVHYIYIVYLFISLAIQLYIGYSYLLFQLTPVIPVGDKRIRAEAHNCATQKLAFVSILVNAVIIGIRLIVY